MKPELSKPLYFSKLDTLRFIRREDNKPPSALSLLGKYTYGMYLYHLIILITTKIIFDALKWEYSSPLQNFVYASVALIITVGISILSYKVFEQHFLRLKRKFESVKTKI